jgi:type I site-specific restriction endonuclease
MGKPTSVYELQHSIADHYLANYQIYLAELHLTLEGVQ